jgi:nitroimidazol reductase NimA-like FMN-containing flavoprotein (pyridoxamine 5'-phosphate oxidase superfamily)
MTLVLYRRANRQYVAMTKAEVWRFIESQSRIFLGFSMPDGYPHVTPIWFVLHGGKVYMRAQSYKVKVRLAATGKACVAVDAGDSYKQLRGAVVWGRSRLVEDPRLVSLLQRKFESKYAKRQWRAEEMPRAWVAERGKEERAFIELVPEKVASWDNSKL